MPQSIDALSSAHASVLNLTKEQEAELSPYFTAVPPHLPHTKCFHYFNAIREYNDEHKVTQLNIASLWQQDDAHEQVTSQRIILLGCQLKVFVAYLLFKPEFVREHVDAIMSIVTQQSPSTLFLEYLVKYNECKQIKACKDFARYIVRAFPKEKNTAPNDDGDEAQVLNNETLIWLMQATPDYIKLLPHLNFTTFLTQLVSLCSSEEKGVLHLHKVLSSEFTQTFLIHNAGLAKWSLKYGIRVQLPLHILALFIPPIVANNGFNEHDGIFTPLHFARLRNDFKLYEMARPVCDVRQFQNTLFLSDLLHDSLQKEFNFTYWSESKRILSFKTHEFVQIKFQNNIQVLGSSGDNLFVGQSQIKATKEEDVTQEQKFQLNVPRGVENIVWIKSSTSFDKFKQSFSPSQTHDIRFTAHAQDRLFHLTHQDTVQIFECAPLDEGFNCVSFDAQGRWHAVLKKSGDRKSSSVLLSGQVSPRIKDILDNTEDDESHLPVSIEVLHDMHMIRITHNESDSYSLWIVEDSNEYLALDHAKMTLYHLTLFESPIPLSISGIGDDSSFLYECFVDLTHKSLHTDSTKYLSAAEEKPANLEVSWPEGPEGRAVFQLSIIA